MRRLFIVILAASTSLLGSLLGACSNPDEIEGRACSDQKPCPSGYTCDPKDNACHKTGTGNPDARPIDARADAAPIDAAAVPDAKLPDAMVPPVDAAPPADAKLPDANVPSIDATVPDANIPLPIAQITGGGEQGFCQLMEKFTYTSTNDPKATFLCGVTDSLVPCEAAGTTFTFPEGSTQLFTVRAVNAAGQGPAVTRSCTVDGIAPVVTIAKPLNMSTQSASVPVEFTVVEAHQPVVVTCTVDDKPQVPCMSPMTLTLPAGMHKLVVTATDPAGNTGSATSNFTVVLTGPLATISSPGEGEITGPETDVVYSVGAGTTKIVCKLDGFEIDCQLPLTLTFSTSGGHTLTVQAFNAAGIGGNIAEVHWFADASPPQIASITFTNQAPGTVKIDFTLTDKSKITDVLCALDDGLFEPCGVETNTIGSVTYTGLNAGTHVIHIFAEDEWGNSGENDITSGQLPGSNVTFPFEVVVGPGHLVLIGYDYWAPPPVQIPKLPGTSPDPNQQLAQLLINAVSQTPALGFGRNVRVGLVNIQVTDEELDNITNILGDLPLTYVTITDDPQSLATALPTLDAILIPDQNGFFIPPDKAKLPQTSPQQMVQTFLNHGGVIVVLDGRRDDPFGDGQLSENYRAVGDLLDIDFAEFNDNNFVRVPCNHDDPLLGNPDALNFVQHSFDLEAASGNPVQYQTFEPWFTFEHRGENQNGTFDNLFVLHKWYGVAEAGPVALSFNDHVNYTFGGNDVMFQDADGNDVRACPTLQNGTAVQHMALPALADRTHLRAGYVSLGNFEGLGFSVGAQFMTVIGVDPLDHIQVPFIQRFISEDTTVDVTVNLPTTNTPAGTNSYRVVFGCSDATSSETTIKISTLTGCHNDAFSYSVVGEAIDANGKVVGYTIQNGVLDGDTVTMPAWKAPNVTPSFTLGTLTDVAGVDFRASLLLDGLNYPENFQSAVNFPATPAFYSDAGAGTPTFDSVEYDTDLFFNDDQDGRVAESVRVERGALSLRPAASLASALLGRVTDVFVDELDSNVLDYAYAGSTFGLDGGRVRMRWDGGNWLVIFPPDDSVAPLQIQLPPPFNDEGLSQYWPSSQIFFDLIALDDVSWLPSYKDYRQHPTGERFLRPERADFLFRRTSLEPANR